MIFYETAIFTSQITKYISDESYMEFQKVLSADPKSGDLIPNSKGFQQARLLRILVDQHLTL